MFADVEGKVDWVRTVTHAMRIITHRTVAVRDDQMVLANDRAEDVQIDTPIDWLLVAPAGYDLHFVATVRTNGSCLIDVYSGPTYSDAGTVIRHMRYNWQSTVTRETAYRGPTLSDDGVLEFEDIITGQAQGSNPIFGGSFAPAEEIILPAGEAALFRVTVDANDTDVVLALDYYEEPAA